MPDEDQVREVIQRIATAALFYYPEIHADDPEYALQKDLEWAFGDDFDVPPDVLDGLRDIAARTIIDPTTHRRDLFDALMLLLPSATD